MSGGLHSRYGAAFVIWGLLSGLAVAAPLVNALGAPPRTVFLQLPEDMPEPSVTLAARRLPSGNWQLEVATTGFRFTAMCVSDAEPAPVGHAHIVMDGVKVASAYAPTADLGPLPPGRHTIAAVLRGQDHRALVGRDGLIAAKLVLIVPET